MAEVTEQDRETVACFLEADGGWTTGYVAKIRSGAYDKSDLIRLAVVVREAAEKAALAAMLEAVGEPIAWRYEGHERSITMDMRVDGLGEFHGFVETPLYSLAALREEGL